MESLLAALPENASEEVLADILAQRINQLISNDFSRLLTLLYRIDIDETQLRRLLREHADQDAGLIIARLILSRQREKAASRAALKKGAEESDIPDDERW
jgi:hypothetical protein